MCDAALVTGIFPGFLVSLRMVAYGGMVTVWWSEYGGMVMVQWRYGGMYSGGMVAMAAWWCR